MTTATPYGCADPDCGYSTLPSTMGTPYAACPLCGGRWTAHPPPQTAATGRTLEERVTGSKIARTYVVRPHLASLYDRWAAAQQGAKPK